MTRLKHLYLYFVLVTLCPSNVLEISGQVSPGPETLNSDVDSHKSTDAIHEETIGFDEDVSDITERPQTISTTTKLGSNDTEVEDVSTSDSVPPHLAHKVYLWRMHTEQYTSVGKSLRGHTFLTIHGKKTNTQCAMECLKYSKCQSFNFELGTAHCMLNDAKHSDFLNDFIDMATAEYHTRDAFSIDQEGLGPCAGDPCNGRGRCLETKSVAGKTMAICLCEDGWRGTGCALLDGGAQWAQWMEWGPCSVSCHRGWRVRHRNCEDSNTQQTLNSGQCYGATLEYGICELHSCPRWEVWGEWGECSTQTTCGRGVKTRTRVCSNGGTVDVDRYCLGLSNESTPCYSASCDGPIRLADGQYPGEGRIEIYDDIKDKWTLICANQMTDYIADLVCHQSGWPGSHSVIQDNRFGQGNGQFSLTSVACSGIEKRLMTCKHNLLTSDGFCSDGTTVAGGVQCNVNGVWSLWAAWGECSVTCENGVRTRTRQCNHPAPWHAGRSCEGEDLQQKQCTMPMCPVDGVWDAWMTWSECSLTCGYGTKTRNRTCFGPFYFGKPCNGSEDDQEPCNTYKCPVDGEWLQWESWGTCSLTCGGGEQRRVRQCKQPLHGGATCDGVGEESRHCNEHNCPIDGVWNMWSDWSDCTVTCAWGWQWRNRTCDGPYHLGAPCEGDDNETQTCHPKNCPVDGQWMDWESWSQCSVSCGGGTRERMRECHFGQFGGQNCTGDGEESGSCNEQPCPVDGIWLPWSDWGECSLTCGNGTQWRYRDCEGPFHGGQNCTGPDAEGQLCNTHYCPVDGVFTEWSEWTICTLTCGGGHRSRERDCIGPFYNVAECVGNWTEVENCNTQNCPVDGSWRPWSEWETCSVTCDGGVRWRDRECDEAQHGGENCTGPSQQNETCNTHHCPVDGIWLDWTDWEPCSVSCGGGRQTRLRNCTGPFHGGQPCQGPWDETQDCNTHNCPVDGVLSPWSEWAACDVTCGGGIKDRNRTCTGPFYGGSDCDGPLVDNTTCNTHECPIDGIFTNWGEWGECSTTCGGGIAWRSRNCIGPFYGGQDCVGAWDDNTTCNEQPCPEDGLWMLWSTWTECSVTCGGGEQSRDRECNGTLYGGKYCEGDHNQTRECNIHHCPVDGIFSDWADWSECTLTCGSGTQWKNRSCIGPFHGGKECEGDFNVTQNCNEHPCPIDGYYSDWSAWGECSVTCGGGSQERNRTCIEPLHGGADCQGPGNESQACNTQNCPVDGYFTDWAEWSICSVTCGGGTQWRNRTCVEPLYGGQACQGPENVTQDCNTQPCPIDGVWLEWSQWSACNTTCGGGLQERVRVCQEPQFGGKACEGVSTEYLSCSENPCPIPGDWFPWTSWTSCTATCGGGTRYRERECDMESYQELTAPCEGPEEETVDCHTFDCLPLAHTCTELGERGLTEDTIADLDPDGPGALTLEPVQVFCDMTANDGVGVTVIGHDQESRHQVQGWEGAREYVVELMYNITFDHVVAIVDQSGYCEQYISWECYAALIHNHNDNNKITTGWLNRTGGVADYFGGATPGSQSCACGMNHTCADTELLCNCDSNDQVWRHDEGLLTFKDDLPVYAFVAGDTGGLKEDGFSIIGPLRCHGKDTRKRKKRRR